MTIIAHVLFSTSSSAIHMTCFEPLRHDWFTILSHMCRWWCAAPPHRWTLFIFRYMLLPYSFIFVYMYACLIQTRSARWVRADCHALRASALSWITTLIVCYSLLDGESHARVQVMAFSKRRAAAATCAMYPICHRRLYLLCFFTYTACEAAAAQSLLVFYFFYVYSVSATIASFFHIFIMSSRRRRLLAAIKHV